MVADAEIPAGRFTHHGGRLCAARSLFPEAPQPWVDLSTGINPWPYPAPRAPRQARSRLPEPARLLQLEAAAAAAFGVADPARVVATGGTEGALRLLPRILDQRRAVIVGPTYGSHADAWMRAGVATQVAAEAALESRAAQSVALTLVNPNNPDGRILERGRLHALHDALQAHGGLLIVDEAFGETAPQASVADLAGGPAPRLIVLRSFGKFYGLAGVRLGFVIAAPQIANVLRHLIGDWPVSADALAAGLAAYHDPAWAQRTRGRLAAAARRLDRLLIRCGFGIAGGTSLFRLACADDARRRFTQLLACGVLVRPFDHDPTLLRFGLPGGRHEWRRLAAALQGREDASAVDRDP